MSDIDGDDRVPADSSTGPGPEPAPRQPHARRRRLIRIAGVGLGILITLVIGILIAIHTRPAKNFVLARVREYLLSQQIDFQAGSLDYNLLNLSVVLDRVVVRGHDLPDAPPFARVGHVEANLSLSDLVRGSYVVERGVVRDATIHLLIDEQGRSNLPQLQQKSQSSGGTVDYLIQQFDLSNATVRYEDRRQQLDAMLPIASITVRGERPTRLHHVQLSAGHGSVLLQGRKADIDTLTTALSFDPNTLTIERADLGAAGSTISLAQQTAIKFSDPQYDFSIRASLDLARLAAIANVDPNEKLAGRVNADVNFRGPLTAFAIRTRLRGDDLTVRTLSNLGLEADVNYDAGARQAQLVSLNVTGPGHVQAYGLLSLDPRAGDSHIDADLRQVDTLALTQAAGVAYSAASKVSGHVKARWPVLEYAKAAGEAHLTLTPTRSTTARGTVPVSGKLDLVTRDGVVIADATQVKALGTTVDGRVTLTTPPTRTNQPNQPPGRRDRGAAAPSPAMAGTLRARAGDLAGVIAAAEAFLGRARGSLVGTPIAGAATVDATLGGTLAAPAVDVTAAAPSLSAGTVTGVALNTQARYTPASVTLTTLDATWQGARLHASGEVGLQGAQPLALTASIDETQIDRVLAAAGRQDLAAAGIVSMQANINGTVKNPAGKVEASLRDLKVQEADYGNVTLNATLADRRAQITAAADKFKLTAHADLATTAPYVGKADVTLDGLDLQTLPPVVAANTPITGIVTAHLTASGDLSKPLDAEAAATIEPLKLTYNDQPIDTDGVSTIRYANRELAIDRLVVHAQDSTVAINGTLPLEAAAGDRAGREGTINLDAKANLATLAKYAPPDAGVKAEGILALAGTIRGTLRRIDPQLTLNLENASVGANALKQDLSNVGLHATIADGALHASDLHATWGSAKITASADVPFGWLPENLPIEIPRQTGAAQIHAAVTGLDLATLPGAPEKLAGAVSLRADFEAPKPDITALSGRIVFPELRLDFNGLTLAQRDNEPSTIALNAGNVTIEKFTLDGTVGHIELSGRAGLIDPRPIDMVARANINAAAAAALFTKQVRLGGQTTVELAATGTAAQPNVRGFLELANGRIAMANPQVAAQGVRLRIDFTPQRVTLSQLDGNLNGGTLSGSGSFALDGLTPRDVNFTIKAADVGFDMPMNLRSQSSADLRISQRGEDIVIGGLVTVQEGGLTDNINLDSGLFAYVNSAPSLDLTEQRSPLLERIKLDVQVKTATPIAVDNNLARAEISADLRVLGTIYETGLSGRLDLLEGSELILNERTYDVQRGVITFIDDRRIVPSLDLQLQTRARRYDINIAISGTPGETQSTLTSTPTLAQPDILALLVTGKTLDEMRGEEFEVARNQVLSYLGGRVGSEIGRSLQKATGLSTVRVEPNLIASETEPTARLTVGQDLTPDWNIVYSTDLVNSADHIWLTEYDITRQFTTRAVRQSDGSYRFDFRHDVRFGGLPEPQRMKKKDGPKIRAITVVGEEEGGAPVSEEAIRGRLKLKVGDTYDYFAMRKAFRRIAELFEAQNRLQSRVRIERAFRGSGKDQQVDLTLRVTPGPVVTLAFDGFTPPKSFIEDARTIWHRGVFDTQRADDVRDALKARLVDDRYLDSKIEYKFDTETDDERRVTFQVEPGVRFEKVTLAFDGARGIQGDDLEGVIKSQKMGPKVFTDPDAVMTLLQKLYRERGYVDATIDSPDYQFDAATRQARVVLGVHEGPQFKIRKVEFAGNTVYPATGLAGQLPSTAGDPYLPSSAEQSLIKLRQLYWAKGYNAVRPSYQLAVDHAAGVLDLTFAIEEGPRSIVASVESVGNLKTSEKLVRAEVEVKEGEPLDLQALARSRKNLYGTGAFALVDITREEAAGRAVADAGTVIGNTLTAAGPGGGGGAGNGNGNGEGQPAPAPAQNPNDVPVNVKVAVREVQPFQIQYGGSFDTERGPGVIFNIANHNSLGKAREVGLQTRYDTQVREVRAYMSQPTLRDFPIATIASIYYREERNPSTSLSESFNIDRMGVSIQQEKKLRNQYMWTYGYRFERSRTWAPDLDGPIPPYTRVSPLTSTFTRDTRDDVMDATHGSYLAHAFSFSPTWLGADTGYLKYFGQYFIYVPLQPPQRKRFTNEILRPRLVYAAGVRLGLAHAFGGEDVPLSERFLAGGSTTLRGFAQNAVGPIGPNGVPLGGEGMLVINNELRFPLIWLFDGATFLDIGEVNAHVSDFSFSDLRKSGGLGLRLRTPWFLVRLDYGVPFDRRANESRSRVFFSIGQAF